MYTRDYLQLTHLAFDRNGAFFPKNKHRIDMADNLTDCKY